MFLFAGAMLISYIAAATRTISAVELRAADAGLLSVVAWIGVQFTAMDAISSRARLDTLLRRLVLAAAALATLGIVQFITNLAFTNYIVIPGLHDNTSLVSLYGRGGLTRPAGTAIHPIEFGAVLTMILPFALHYAITDRTRSAGRRWYPVLAIAVAVPISISKSAIVSVTVVLIFLLPTMARAIRRRIYAALPALLAGLYVLVPGLLGTLSGLFTGLLGGDSSTQSRTDSYSFAWHFISRQPFFGRGFQTFLPSYRIFDNEYLLLLVEAGFVGTFALMGLFTVGVLSTLRDRRATPDALSRQLGAAFAASVASALMSFALFDAFSFPMAASLIFLILGCAGAWRRLAVAPSDVARTGVSHPQIPV